MHGEENIVTVTILYSSKSSQLYFIVKVTIFTIIIVVKTSKI